MNTATIYRQYLSKAGGAGSRGGHVIGHTKSGKPVYARVGSAGRSFMKQYSHFTEADHRDAAQLHRKASQKQNDSGLQPYERHSFHEELHDNVARHMQGGEGKDRSYHQKMHAYHVKDRIRHGERMGDARSRGDWSSHSAEKLNGQASAMLAEHHRKQSEGG